jgi:hypothetical protein
MKEETVKELEALLDTSLEHFSHGWRALEKQGMVAYKDPNVFPPSVSDKVGSASYHFAAVADTVKRAHEIIAAEQERMEKRSVGGPVCACFPPLAELNEMGRCSFCDCRR